MRRKSKITTILMLGIGLVFIFGVIIFVLTQNLGGQRAEAGANLPLIISTNYDFSSGDPQVGDNITVVVSTIVPDNTRDPLALSIPIKFEKQVLNFSDTAKWEPGPGFIGLGEDNGVDDQDSSYNVATRSGDFNWISLDVSRQNTFDNPYGGELVLASFTGEVIQDSDTTVEIYLPKLEFSSNTELQESSSTFTQFLDISQSDNLISDETPTTGTDDSSGSTGSSSSGSSDSGDSTSTDNSTSTGSDSDDLDSDDLDSDNQESTTGVEATTGEVSDSSTDFENDELPQTDYIPALGLDPFDIRTWSTGVLISTMVVLLVSVTFIYSILQRNL